MTGTYLDSIKLDHLLSISNVAIHQLDFRTIFRADALNAKAFVVFDVFQKSELNGLQLDSLYIRYIYDG